MEGTRFWKKLDGEFVSDDEVIKAIYIVNGDKVSYSDLPKYILDNCFGLFSRSVDNLTIEDLVRAGQVVKAVKLYYDTYKDKGVSIVQSRDAVYKLREELKKV